MKILSKILIIIVLILFNTKLLATPQTGDLLIIGKDTILIYQFPLDQLFQQKYSHNPGFFDTLSTACWRGYKAIWIIHDNKLFLKEIYNCNLSEKTSIERIGRQKDSEGLIFADWFNGRIKIDLYKKKEITEYWNLGRIFIKKITIKIKDGRIETRPKIKYNNGL
jgi:hypothetical protein